MINNKNYHALKEERKEAVCPPLESLPKKTYTILDIYVLGDNCQLAK
jgi:hypothetical protein